MKGTKSRGMRSLSMLLIFAIFFSLFSGIVKVEAAPEVRNILYERTITNTGSGPVIRDTLTIYGRELDNPKVFAGTNSQIAILVNTGLSTTEKIVIDDPDSLKLMAGKVNRIEVYSGSTGQVGSTITYDLTKIPTISNTSQSKVYINEPLSVDGMYFESLNPATDKILVAGTEYTLDTTGSPEALINIALNKITIDKTKSPVFPGLSDISLVRNVGAGGNYQIATTLKNSITVVDRLKGIDIERVDPNTGPRQKSNIVNIYAKQGPTPGTYLANFNSFMRVFVNGKEGKNLGTITNMAGTIIGLTVALPTSDTVGAANILITNSNLTSEYEYQNGFIYLDIGNTLSIDSDGINPNFKKETEIKPITITGRNIGYFDPAGYDKLSNVSYDAQTGQIGYAPYKTIPQFNNITSYKVKYQGLYNGRNVTILRQIDVFIDGAATIKATPQPTFEKSKDTLVVDLKDVNLDENVSKTVDVTIKTNTVIFDETDPNNIIVFYTRNEEATTKNGFTYLPDEIAPQITSITPEFGPKDKDVYMTIRGKDFQVFENGTLPEVKIGYVTYKDLKVYDDMNREVDGKKISFGTKIKLIIPRNSINASGAVDVVVKNPSKGQAKKVNGFELRNPTRADDKMPQIISVKEAYADMRGGAVSGETVVITGENFDTALEGSPRVTITIDGEKATIQGKVSADGKTVTIIPPPGTMPGGTMLQLINEDGSMAEKPFEYKRIITAPKITKIVPIKGGNGTKLVIKGEDFLLPDGSMPAFDPKRKGTVVLLNGKELNAYNYKLPEGYITSVNDSIYYKTNSFDGEMVKVQDSTTIYVDIPDKFYSLDKNLPAPFLASESIPQGDLTVEVLNPDGAKSKEKVTFEYLKPASRPTITSILPASGATTGGTVITIRGTDFKKDDIKVYFGAEQAAKVEYINTTELVVQAPAYPYGLPKGRDNIFVPIMVMNYDGAMAVFDKPGFEYRIPGSKPSITGLSPSKGSAAGGERIVISGRDFRRRDDNSAPPKVYFNGIEAAVEWVSDVTLIATAPPSKKEGPVDVVLVNYDSGSYTYKSYTYEISKPAVTSIIPGVIAKQGGTRVQINGTNFTKGDFSAMLTGEQVNRNTSTPVAASTQIDNLVIFGDTATGDKKIIDTVLGPFQTDINELRVEYQRDQVNIDTGIITLSRVNGSTVTQIKQVHIPFGSAHLFIVNGQQDLGDSKLVDEGVLVEVTPNQVIVTRRVAAYAKWENEGKQITAIAPAVGSINKRSVYVQNSDGGTATSEIDVMNPASNPTITYISPRNKVKQAGGIIDYTRENPTLDQEYYTYTPLNGGAFITINGSDFRRNVKVYMGNKLLEIVSRGINDDQLIVKVPKGTEDDLNKLYRILIINEDGASADSSTISKPHYIVYKLPQSNPIIENVIPSTTSAKGQNTVRIIGNDFRAGAKVYIDGIESTSVTLINYKELAVKVPLGLTPGKKLIQIMNPDFGFGEKRDAINIVSSPQIDNVYDAKKNVILSPIVLSIDGGQTIKLTGRDYLDGAKVIIGGTLKAKADVKQGETGITCYNIYDAEMVIVGGTEATNIKIENSGTLTFTTPKLKVGDVSIIVVNTDGGVSNVINGSYQKPVPDSPSGLSAEVVDSDVIKLEWDIVPGTSHYELYAAYSSDGSYTNNYVYVGSMKAYEVTEGRLRYFADGLKASSWYSFKLKSVNSYGPSAYSSSTSFMKTKDKKLVTYYQVVGDYESGIAQNDKITTLGNSLIYAAGEKSMRNYGGGLVVFLNQASYNGYNPKTVDIGLELLRKYPSNTVTINEKDFAFKAMTNTLLVREANAVSLDNMSDSKMSIIFNKDLKAKGDEIRMKIPKGYKAVTAPFGLNVNLQVGQNKTGIKGLNGSANITFNISDDMKRRYPGGIYIAYYNTATRKLELLRSQAIGNTMTAQTTRPGEYLLVGKFTR